MHTAAQPASATTGSNSQPLPVGWDGGNGHGKLVIGDAEIKLPSYFQPIARHFDSEIAECEGAIIEYLEGDRTDLSGQRWLVGDAAYSQSPLSYQRVSDDARGKINHGLQILLGAIALLPPRQYWDLRVVASIQDAQVFGADLVAAMKGHHVVILNGRHTTIDIDAKPAEEGFGAIYQAIKSNAVGRDDRAILLDLGHGTSITSVFDGGKLMRDSRRVHPAGVGQLVEAIAKHPDTRRQLSAEGDRHLIRLGIENHSFEYGYSNWNFRSIYEVELKPWVQSTLAPALKNAAPWRSSSAAILASGGGAQLPGITQLLAKQGIAVLADGRWANARGLSKIAQSYLRRAA